MQNNQNTHKPNNESRKKIAWVAGATGLIGGQLIKQLCSNDDYEQVVAFIRPGKSLDVKHPKFTTFECNWDQLLASNHSKEAQFEAPGQEVDELFCALGSTTKRTPDKHAYRKIDVEYPEAFAKLGKTHGASFYGLVSAHGASTKLPSFYLGMKKEVEQKVRAADFPHVAIARPSLLLGERTEFRLAESASEWFCKLLPGNYKAIEAHDVAAALIKAASKNEAGCHILQSAEMQGALND